MLILLFSVLFFLLDAKGQGEIYGILTDSKGELLNDVSIKVYNGDRFFGRSLSEEDGSYSVKPLPSGYYTVEYSLNGFLKRKTINVIVNSGGSVKLNYKMIEGSSDSEIVMYYKSPPPPPPPPRPRPYPEDDRNVFLERGSVQSLSKNVEISRIPKIKPEKISLSWAEQLKYTNFPLEHRQKQITKKYNEKDFQYIPFGHFLETLPETQR